MAQRPAAGAGAVKKLFGPEDASGSAGIRDDLLGQVTSAQRRGAAIGDCAQRRR